jgi:hypothetical protein
VGARRAALQTIMPDQLLRSHDPLIGLICTQKAATDLAFSAARTLLAPTPPTSIEGTFFLDALECAVVRPLEALLDPLALVADGLDDDGHFCTHFGVLLSLGRAIDGVNRPAPQGTGAQDSFLNLRRPSLVLSA